MTEELDIEEARSLVGAIRDLAQMAGRVLPRSGGPLAERLRTHLGLDDMASVPNTSVSVPTIEHPNLQLALDSLERDADDWDVIGLSADIGNYQEVSLPGLLGATWHGPGETGRQYESVDVSATEQIDCLRAGIVLTVHDGAPVALLLYQRRHGMEPELVIEAAADTQAAADAFLATVRALMDEHNVMRGNVVTFTFGRHGDFGLSFLTLPPVERDQVVLPEPDLAAIEQHALGISEHREDLAAAGQHIKRGLLLYGPPGTGKTHTVSYLLTRMHDRTSIVLSGAAVSAVGQAGSIAKSLQPATIVIEDVDLIGIDRSLPGGEHNPLLFQLLNEMDGLAEDADVLFILTTNRVDLLEPALAARPGRIDQAVEIGLPDADDRRRLLDLYLDESIDESLAARLVDGTAGVAAAFVKELVRRATLRRMADGGSTTDHLDAALTEIREHSAPILQRTLAPDPRD